MNIGDRVYHIGTPEDEGTVEALSDRYGVRFATVRWDDESFDPDFDTHPLANLRKVEG